MTEHQRVGDLEITQDLQFWRRDWLVQCIGRIVWALLILAALLGVFGHGWLANGQVADAEGALSAEYERIAHVQGPCRMEIRIAPDAVSGSDLRLWIKRDYLDEATIRMISPEPVHMETAGSRIIYVFRLGDSDQPAHVTMDLELEKFGHKEIELGLVGGPELAFDQIVLP